MLTQKHLYTFSVRPERASSPCLSSAFSSPELSRFPTHPSAISTQAGSNTRRQPYATRSTSSYSQDPIVIKGRTEKKVKAVEENGGGQGGEGSTCSVSVSLGHPQGIWKFPGQGSNLSWSHDLRHSRGHARSLTHCVRPPSPPRRQAGS